jgi:hypothetical protein
MPDVTQHHGFSRDTASSKGREIPNETPFEHGRGIQNRTIGGRLKS